MTNTGIYLIENTNNGKVYVGSTQHLSQRWTQHWRELRAGRHCNRNLQGSWDKHGEAAFRFAVLEHCAPEDLVIREGWWVTLLDATAGRRGYNLGAMVSGMCSDETRARMAASHKGRPRPDLIGRKQSLEEKANQSAAQKGKSGLWNKGRKHSEETRAKVSAAGKGRKHSAETKAKMAATALRLERRPPAKKGRPVSGETRAKISAANKGRQPTEEQRAKMRAAKKTNPPQGMKGKKHSAETRAKMSETRQGRKMAPEFGAAISARMKGNPKSPEHIAKIAETHRGKKMPPEAVAKSAAARRGLKQSPETIAKRLATLQERYPEGRVWMMGKQHSEETRAKMSAARKSWWERRHLETDQN